MRGTVDRETRRDRDARDAAEAVSSLIIDEFQLDSSPLLVAAYYCTRQTANTTTHIFEEEQAKQWVQSTYMM